MRKVTMRSLIDCVVRASSMHTADEVRSPRRSTDSESQFYLKTKTLMDLYALPRNYGNELTAITFGPKWAPNKIFKW
jgi:hypothetical protein